MPLPPFPRRLLGAAFGALLLSGCLSPTLPLPPPARPTVEGPDASGNVRLTGRVPSRSRVTAQNQRTNLISGQRTDERGTYDFTIAAAVGDEILLWYSRHNTNSPAIVIRVRESHRPDEAAGGAGGMGGAGAD